MARPMTEEEYMRQYIMSQKLRSGMGAPMTMQSQIDAELKNVDPSKIPRAPEKNPFYTAPEKDFSSEERTIANQREYANTLRGAETPGLKTVGPYNVAVTNYAEGAETMGNRLLGGYLSGKADQKSKGLSKAKQAAAESTAESEADVALNMESIRQGDRTVDAGREDARYAAEDAQWLKDFDQTAGANTARQNQAQANSTIPIIQFDESGNDIPGTNRFATKRADGLYIGDEKVDDTKYRPWDNPNLTSATLAGTKPTQQSEKAGYLSTLYDSSVNNLFTIMEEGYDPTNAAALWDKLTTKSDVSNFLASDDGQQWASDVETAKESALRTATGAAAPETENARYVVGLFPRPGDKTKTVARKKVKLRVYGEALARLGRLHPDLSPDVLVAGAAAEARKVGNDIKDDEEASAAPAVIDTQDAFDALPSGALYIDPEDGKPYRKP